MRYSLRTLVLVMLIAGPVCAFAWTSWTAFCAWQAEQAALLVAPIPPAQLVPFEATVQMKVRLPEQPNLHLVPHHPMEAVESIPMTN